MEKKDKKPKNRKQKIRERNTASKKKTKDVRKRKETILKMFSNENFLLKNP